MSIFNFSKSPRGFLIALSIILSFEAANIFFDKYFRSPESESGHIVELKNKLSQSSENCFDVLVLGDCFNHAGIMPIVIDSNTGFSCYNFSAFSQQTIISQYCFLKNYLDASQVKPKFIIIGFKRISLATTREQVMKRFIHNFYDFKEGNIDVFLKEFGFGETVKFFLPSLEHQDFLKNFIKDLFLAEISGKREKEKNAANQVIYVDKGFVELKGVYKGNIKEIEGIYKRFSVTPFFSKYLRYILDLAKENDIQVIYTISTNTPDVFKIAKKNDVVEDYENFIASFQIEYPNLTFIYPQDALNKKKLYSNQNHLNGEGALILSKLLADKINTLNERK